MKFPKVNVHHVDKNDTIDEAGDDGYVEMDIDNSEYVVVDKLLLSEANDNDAEHITGASSSASGADVEGDSPTRGDATRKEENRISQRRTMNRAKSHLDAEHVSSFFWHPKRCFRIYPVVGMDRNCKWQFDQLIRANCPYVGAHSGISLSFNITKVRVNFKKLHCIVTMEYYWQPRTCLWNRNKFV